MEQNNACSDEIDLFELFQKLYEQRWTILGITALTTVLAILVSIFMPKAYKAEAMVEVPIIQGSKVIDISEIQESIKVYKKDDTLKDILKNIKVFPVKNSQNMAKIEVEGASPQMAKENLEKILEIINKKLFTQKIEELNKKYTIRVNSINQTISETNSRNDIIYDPSKFADLLTEKEQIQKWLQDPKFVILATEIQTSSEPVRPKPLLYTLIGFITGIFLGIFVALVREAIKSRKVN
ncbi:Wzz/FepE/Etk N-terminal domain-containing protein [Sulfurihydrogenibium sp.]|jgi:capsular polysaccharide biosynthesis protein|uniref:Wzz/FepE/Etk N-terminal domain-containing protein n=1 Tax=Sulfurihydrogenibium sp. TaxID=2053621 RepID=UPI00260F9561|nr:Wzz/FepE/Etk N-terminal domain-containing protein [Sulfurihydrogenibium sp.]